MRGALHLGALREFNRLLAIRHGQRGDRRDRFGLSKPGVPVEAASEQAAAGVLALPKSPPQSARESKTHLVDHLTVYVGQMPLALGSLKCYAKGDEVFSEFAYEERWAKSSRFFPVSPDLARTAECQRVTPLRSGGLDVFAALADAMPSGFGDQVMREARERGLLGTSHEQGGMLGALGGLKAVPDAARLGALRIAPAGQPPDDPPLARFILPCETDLPSAAQGVIALERGTANMAQLQQLMASATALGGSRPKVTWVGKDSALWIAKLPSAPDGSLPNRAEALGMLLAKMAGINAIDAKLLHSASGPFLVAPRLDRDGDGKRRPYLSARSLLPASDHDLVDPTELLGVMRERCLDFSSDARQFWLRLLFMRLTHQPGDELRKFSFVYTGNGRWRLAPAYGLRLHPVPMKLLMDQQAAGQRLVVKVQALMQEASAFGIEPEQALEHLDRQLAVLAQWKNQAALSSVGMRQVDMAQFHPAMNQTLVERERLRAKCRRELHPIQR